MKLMGLYVSNQQKFWVVFFFNTMSYYGSSELECKNSSRNTQSMMLCYVQHLKSQKQLTYLGLHPLSPRIDVGEDSSECSWKQWWAERLNLATRVGLSVSDLSLSSFICGNVDCHLDPNVTHYKPEVGPGDPQIRRMEQGSRAHKAKGTD